VPSSRAARVWTRDQAIAELVRGRMTMLGPTSARELAASLRVEENAIERALHALESEGVILRGAFTRAPDRGEVEWCDRRLLARIHRYTLNRLRAEIEPVSPAELMRFLFDWQHVSPASRLSGIEGVRAALAVLHGFELPATAWERQVLPARVDGYDPAMLDVLCLTGQVGWARGTTGTGQMVGATPVVLFLRDRDAGPPGAWPAQNEASGRALGESARRVLDALRARGASFAPELIEECAFPADDLQSALSELVTAGLVTSDGFAGLRSLVDPARHPRRTPAHDAAGRWSIRQPTRAEDGDDAAVERHARTLLRRYGIVCRRVLVREAAATWRELTRVYRRLELRGEIRGGRFVSGLSGEQFALPEAVTRLREVRRAGPDGRLIVISGADPLNLAGIVTAGERVRAVAGTRIAYRDGVPLACMEGDYIRPLAAIEAADAGAVATALAGRPVPPVISGFVGRAG
jgi:ATP-dependent Lhr-like helicase